MAKKKKVTKKKPRKEPELDTDLADRLDAANSFETRMEIILLQMLRELKRLR